MLESFQLSDKDAKQAFIDFANEHGNTSLHWAALGGHLDVVKLLLEHGASPALANERNYVPLDLANFNNHTEVAQYFLSSLPDMEKENGANGLSEGAEKLELENDEEKQGSV